MLHPNVTVSAGTALEVGSDEEGVIQFHYQSESALVDNLLLDCQAQSGAVASYSIKVQATADAPALTAPKPKGPVRPALTGDPLALTDTQLRALDYPPRPDPVAAPDAYQQWLQLVSRPATKVSSKMTGMHARHTGVSSNNCAAFSGTANPPYTEVQAYWNVPYITGEHIPQTPTTDYSCFWVGVGYFGSGTNDDMYQGGTEQDILVYYVTGYWVNIRNYYPWVEVIDKRNDAPTADGRCCGQVVYNGFYMQPGDTMWVELWIGDINGNGNASLTPPLYAWWYIHDATRGTYAFDYGGWWYVDTAGNAHFARTPPPSPFANDGRLPSFIQFTGQSAEWVVERTETDPAVLSHLTQFSPTLMNGAYATVSGSYNWLPFSTQAPTQLTMTSDGSSNSPVLATASTVSGNMSAIQFQWYRYY